MIALVQGTVVRKEGDAVVILVQGVGYRLRVPVDVLCDLEEGQESRLHVHTHVRDDAIELFGFTDLSQLRLFERLLGVQKIGPRLALALLSAFPAREIVEAIRGEDLASLSRAPGVGKKTAERLVLELRDKLDDLAGEVEAQPRTPAATAGEDIVSALVNLGYTRKQAESAAAQAAQEAPDAPLEQVLRLALRRLAG